MDCPASAAFRAYSLDQENYLLWHVPRRLLEVTRACNTNACALQPSAMSFSDPNQRWVLILFNRYNHLLINDKVVTGKYMGCQDVVRLVG